MGLKRMGPPEALILALKSQAGWADFIETGTFRGETARWASRHFQRVTTIELSETYHSAAKSRFRDQPGVTVLLGSSATVLRDLVPKLESPALFWLDAHWSGLDTAGRESECPLLEELAIINAARVTHSVLVDDARLFCAPPPPPHKPYHWPGLFDTVATLHNGDSRHVALHDDVFIAVPPGLKAPLTAWLQEAALLSRPKGGLSGWIARMRS